MDGMKSRFNSNDLYTVFGVDSDASHSEIKKMYQQLILKFHPDKFNPQTTNCSYEEAKYYFHVVGKAWKTLSNPESRQKYDETLQDIQLNQEWPVDAEVDLSEMDFDEEDNHYTWPCRCSGSYIITEENLERDENIVCCSTCTLTIKVLFCTEEEQD